MFTARSHVLVSVLLDVDAVSPEARKRTRATETSDKDVEAGCLNRPAEGK